MWFRSRQTGRRALQLCVQHVTSSMGRVALPCCSCLHTFFVSYPQESFGDGTSTALHALDLLIGEVFFTSPRLASLSTQAEVLSRELAARKAKEPGAAATQLLEEYQCSICLDTLHNPVVLTCAHRFCWGCLVAHCTASRDARLPIGKDQATAACCQPATSYRVLEQIAAMGSDAEPTFYPCPVCRKPQILDIDTLQVDTYLEQFITNLQAISSVSVTTQQQPGGASPTASPGAGTVTVTVHQHQQDTHLKLQLVPKQKQASVTPQPWGIIPPQLPQHRVSQQGWDLASTCTLSCCCIICLFCILLTLMTAGAAHTHV
jgi:hypothetical protein